MSEPVTPRPAATVIPVRDGVGGLEVLMVTRATEVSFMGGASVFPGGRVDERDHDVQFRDVSRGAVPATLLAELPEDEARAHCVAAARELFEEAGLYLGEVEDVEELRRAHARGEVDFATVVGQLGALRFDWLRYVAHWITPENFAKRFDTRFFIAPAPPGLIASPDQHEMTDVAWRRPDEALRAGERGEITLMIPTRATLADLTVFSDVAALWEWADAQRAVTCVRPSGVTEPTGSRNIWTTPNDQAGR